MIDSESIDYYVWQQIYESYDQDLSLDKWISGIGSSHMFDPIEDLQMLLDRSLDSKKIIARHDQQVQQLEQNLSLMPGVMSYIQDAKKYGLKVALGSSSNCSRIRQHLSRLNILDYFDSIKCSDDVTLSKPDPEVFELVLAELKILPEQTIILEDTPNGVIAAKRAGTYIVAVPCKMTASLTFEDADLRLSSLTDMSLKTLINKINEKDSKS